MDNDYRRTFKFYSDGLWDSARNSDDLCKCNKV